MHDGTINDDSLARTRASDDRIAHSPLSPASRPLHQGTLDISGSAAISNSGKSRLQIVSCLKLSSKPRGCTDELGHVTAKNQLGAMQDAQWCELLVHKLTLLAVFLALLHSV